MAQQHPTNPSAQLVTTISGSTSVPHIAGTEVDWDITIWSVGGGNYDYTLELVDLAFHGQGQCQGLVGVSLSDICEAVSDDAIQEGVDQGYPGCSTTQFDRGVKIYVQSCGVRSGLSCSMKFEACGDDWAYRQYNVSCPGTGSPPTITQGVGSYSDCSGQSGCEPSYAEPSSLE